MCDNDSNGSIERPNFFVNQLLTADDLKTLVDYFRNKHRLHNKYLHGYGIVFGLEVSVTENNHSVVINPGLALDCEGNEIAVYNVIERALPQDKSSLYVVVEYHECKSESVPVFLDDCNSPADNLNSSRIRESYKIKYDENKSWKDFKSRKLNTWKFEVAAGIPLALIKFRRGRWKVSHCFRRPLLE